MSEWINPTLARVSSSASSGQGTTITASASTNTKGTYTQLFAATAFSCQMIFVQVQVGTGTTGLLDIAIGAAASEQVIVPNLLINTNVAGGAIDFLLPVSIPAGTRVSARYQSATASGTVALGVVLLQQGWGRNQTFDKLTDLGALTASSTGTALGNPASANTWGAWTSLGSPVDDWEWVVPVIGIGTVTTRTSGQRYWWTLGIGASGSEVQIYPEPQITSSASSFGVGGVFGLPIHVSSGVSISGRYASGATTTLGMVMAVYGAVG